MMESEARATDRDDQNGLEPREDTADPHAPIVHEIELPVSTARAYDSYVHGLTEWWPASFSASRGALDRIEVDPHPGGEIIEYARTGAHARWGQVIDAWPGVRFAHTFALGHDGDPSTVTVSFTELPQGGTRVHFEHGGWNGSNAAAREQFAAWPELLEQYRRHATHQ